VLVNALPEQRVANKYRGTPDIMQLTVSPHPSMSLDDKAPVVGAEQTTK
jgi:hypothetical protein